MKKTGQNERRKIQDVFLIFSFFCDNFFLREKDY